MHIYEKSVNMHMCLCTAGGERFWWKCSWFNKEFPVPLLERESSFPVHGVMVWIPCEDSASIHSYEIYCTNTDVSYHILLVLFYLLLSSVIQLYQLNLETSDQYFKTFVSVCVLIWIYNQNQKDDENKLHWSAI